LLLAYCYESSVNDNAKSTVVFLLQAFLAEAMLIMATVIHLGKSGLPTKVIGTFYSTVNVYVCEVFVFVISWLSLFVLIKVFLILMLN